MIMRAPPYVAKTNRRRLSEQPPLHQTKEKTKKMLPNVVHQLEFNLNDLKFGGDSSDYHVLEESTEHIKDLPGMTCEIGLREGAGTKAILDGLLKRNKRKPHIVIDRYGHLEYQYLQHDLVAYDYSNQMRDRTLLNLFAFTYQMELNVIFFCMDDEEFFKRFADGVPIYDQKKKRIETQYCLVHLDGPHWEELIRAEIEWFNDRMMNGGVIVVDDVNLKDYNKIHDRLIELNFCEIISSPKKKAYQKQ